VRRKKPKSARKKLSTDALIWKIVKSRGPIPLKDIVEAVKRNPSTVWRNIALLESEELIRETQPDSREYVPFEWSDVEVSVIEALDEFKEDWSVKVTLNKIANKTGQPPENIKEYAYRWAPKKGLEIAEENEKIDIAVIR